MDKSFDLVKALPLNERRNGYLLVETRLGRSIFYDCEIQFRSESRFFTLTCQILDVDRSRQSYSVMAFEDQEHLKPILFTVIYFIDGSANTIDVMTSFIDPRMKCLGPMMIAHIHAVVFHNVVIDRTPLDEAGKKRTKWYVLFSKRFPDSTYESTGTRLPDFISATSNLLQK